MNRTSLSLRSRKIGPLLCKGHFTPVQVINPPPAPTVLSSSNSLEQLPIDSTTKALIVPEMTDLAPLIKQLQKLTDGLAVSSEERAKSTDKLLKELIHGRSEGEPKDSSWHSGSA